LLAITDTTFRDAHQSLLATRMKLDDLLPIAAEMDKVGFHSMEVWGGATFDTCVRFLNEDPWDRLRAIRKHLTKTKTQMLLRGQNLVGYKHYPDDVVDEFLLRAVGNGMDIIRIFDAVNDTRNMARAIAAAKKAGAHVQGTVVYTISPVHTNETFAAVAKELRDLGADSICVKDMAGLMDPYGTHDLVLRIKAATSLPVQLHCHYTSGMASMVYLKGVEAGADAIDTAISSMALGTSQPPTETMVAALRGTQWDTGLDLGILSTIAEYFKGVRRKYASVDVGTTVDTNVLQFQIPGGMVSNFVSQLSQQNALHRLPEVLAEVPRVRQDLGYPPLVTPTSQIVGSQAAMNVLAGRYKMISNEVKGYLRGEYGRAPAPVNEELRRQAVGDAEMITGRPADLLSPGLEEAKKGAAPFMIQEEDILTYALFPPNATKFFQERLAAAARVDSTLVDEARKNSPVPYHPV
jgi:pyruvate/oxaloacetate carboxyltransferase